jgi:hypothetical protein
MLATAPGLMDARSLRSSGSATRSNRQPDGAAPHCSAVPQLGHPGSLAFGRSAVKTATYRVAVGVKTAGVRR